MPSWQEGYAASAVAVAARAARRYWVGNRSFRRCVTSTDVQVQGFQRAAYRRERRDVVLQTTPGHGIRKGDLRPLPEPEAVDPWQANPGGLPAASRVPATCPACDGSKKVACLRCVGIGRLRCGDCGGDGKVRGERGLKNCPGCRGRGDVKCPDCARGRIPCETCDAKGKVVAWLEVTSEQHCDVQLHPETALTRMHAGLFRGDLSAAMDERSPAALRSDSDWVSGTPAAVIPEPLQPQVDPRRDRILAHRLQGFEAPAATVAYATPVGHGTLEVVGRAPQLVPGPGWAPLRRRRGLIVATGVGMMVTGASALAMAAHQHAWYQAHLPWGPMASIAAVMGLLAGVLAAQLCLPAGARSRGSWGGAAAGLLLSVAALALGWVTHQPTAAEAQQHLAAGNLEAAGLTIDALEHTGHTEAEALAAQLAVAERQAQQARWRAEDLAQLERLQAAGSVEEATRLVSLRWNTEAVATQARAAYFDRVDAKTRTLYEAGRPDGLAHLQRQVATVEGQRAEDMAVLLLLTKARSCANRGDYTCAADNLDQVREHGTPAELTETHDHVTAELAQWFGEHADWPQDPNERLAVLQATEQNLAAHKRLTDAPPPIAKRKIETALRRTKAQLARQQRRAKAAARREARAERAAAAHRTRQQRQAPSRARACCKICRKGKACGDSCISRSYSCHQPQGCACNG